MFNHATRSARQSDSRRRIFECSVAALLAAGGSTVPAAAQDQQVAATADESDIITVEGRRLQGYRIDATGTATRTNTPIGEIPLSIQVIPAEVIRDQAAFELKDTYRNVSGVRTDANGVNTANTESALIRGFQNFSLYRNGFPTRSIGTFDLASIEAIDVLKGPASVMFGQVEAGGLINVRTKRPLDFFFVGAEQKIGSYDFYRTTVDISGPLDTDGTFLGRLNAAYTNTDSFRDFFKIERLLIAPSIAIRPGDNTEINLEVTYTKQENPWDDGISLSPDGRFVADRSTYLGEPSLAGSRKKDLFLTADVSHRLSDQLTWRANFLWHRFKHPFEAFRKFGSPNADGTVRRNYERRELETTESQFLTDLVYKTATGAVEHELVVGIDAKDSNVFVSRDRDTRPVFNIDIVNPVYGIPTPITTPFVADELARSTAIYFQDQITLFDDRLHILIGGRYDEVRQTSRTLDRTIKNTDFTGRAGALFDISDSVSIYASYSESFRPTDDALFFEDINGGALPPEKGRQYEAGAKFNLFNKRLGATIALFEITKSNIPVEDPEDPDFSVNGGEQRSRGLEVDISGAITKQLNIIAQYAHLDTEVLKSDFIPIGAPLRNIPRHSGSIWMSYVTDKVASGKLGFGGGVFAESGRGGDLQNSFRLPGYARVDASIWYETQINGGPTILARLAARNLLDKVYYESSTSRVTIMPGEPFTLIGSIGVKF